MSWRRSEQVLAERQYLSTRLWGVTSQKSTIMLLTVVRTSNPTNVPGAMRPDSDAGPLCSTSLTKMPSRILPQMLNPRPVKSWLLRATTFTWGSWQHKRHHSTLLYRFVTHTDMLLFLYSRQHSGLGVFHNWVPGEYLYPPGVKLQNVGENCVTHFMICTSCQLLPWWSDQGVWDRRGMWHAWERIF